MAEEIDLASRRLEEIAGFVRTQGVSAQVEWAQDLVLLEGLVRQWLAGVADVRERRVRVGLLYRVVEFHNRLRTVWALCVDRLALARGWARMLNLEQAVYTPGGRLAGSAARPAVPNSGGRH